MSNHGSSSPAIDRFIEQLSAGQRKVFCNLDKPAQIQAFLDQTPYSTEDATRSPLNVLRDGVAHCLDGGLFGAAALRRLGYPPLILDLRPQPGIDDDHVLAIYRRHGCFGAVAKSNFAGLRAREPVYRTLRELVLSYFEFYYNVAGQKTLRGFTRPMDLARLDHLNWLADDCGAAAVEVRLYRRREVPLLTPEMAAELEPMDRLTYEAGMLGVNPAGLYKPKA